MQPHALIIDGKSVATKDHFEVRNPSTGEVVGLSPLASKADIDAAIAAAQTAFASWSQSAHEDRKALLHKIADTILANAEELAQLLTLEQGKPLNGIGSRFELAGTEPWVRYAANTDMPVKVLQDNNAGHIEMHRKPIGVVLSITPWNWPIAIAVSNIMPAIRAGNAVIVKPSPYTPLSTLRLVEIINTVTPPGLVSCIVADNDMASYLGSHPGIGKIAFTGSTATGRKIMANASETLKRLTLELGGNDAGIVLPDANPRQIAEGVFWGAFINGGQTCAALKRLYVHDSIYEEMCEALKDFAEKIPMGDGRDETMLMGPIQNKMQFDKVNALVEDAKARNRRVLMGGAPKGGTGYFYPITLVADAEAGDPLVDEEQFGPALPIIRYSDVEEVIAAANNNPNGLGGSVWSPDIKKATEVAKRLECGTVWINKHGPIQPDVPFGGIKNSGFGLAFGEEGFAEYTNTQVISA